MLHEQWLPYRWIWGGTYLKHGDPVRDYCRSGRVVFRLDGHSSGVDPGPLGRPGTGKKRVEYLLSQRRIGTNQLGNVASTLTSSLIGTLYLDPGTGTVSGAFDPSLGTSPANPPRDSITFNDQSQTLIQAGTVFQTQFAWASDVPGRLHPVRK